MYRRKDKVQFFSRPKVVNASFEGLYRPITINIIGTGSGGGYQVLYPFKRLTVNSCRLMDQQTQRVGWLYLKILGCRMYLIINYRITGTLIVLIYERIPFRYQVPILRSMQCPTHTYGDSQNASRICLREYLYLLNLLCWPVSEKEGGFRSLPPLPPPDIHFIAERTVYIVRKSVIRPHSSFFFNISLKIFILLKFFVNQNHQFEKCLELNFI